MANLSIQRVLSLPAVLLASTLYIVKAATADHAELYFTSADGTSVRRVITKDDVASMIAAATSATANKLTTARTITASGDASWEVSFDGSANAASVLTLTATGVSAGEYPVVTVDAKGRVISARALTSTDIPVLPPEKISGTLSNNTTGNAATASEAVKLTTARKINGVDFNGTSDITINAVDATPRIAVSEKGIANGVATLDGAGLVPASQLPSYVDDVLEFANVAALPAVGETGKIYVAIETGIIYRWSGSQYIAIPSGVGLADAALKLQTARTIASTGDVSFQVSFDGSQNVSGVATLADVVVAGNGPVVTYDAKGRVVASRALVQADIPMLDSTTVTSAQAVTLGKSEW